MVGRQYFLLEISLMFIIQSNAVQAQRHFNLIRSKRQVSLSALIDEALNLVRPMIDTSKPLQDDTKIPKQLSSEKVSYRESEILGSPRYSSLQEVPLCRGNSALCSFISCTAKNFKNDQSFANLNLAAQVLADTKLRKGISRDPDALLAVCHEQGLSKPECKLFAKGFQLVDKFFTTIESKAPTGRHGEGYHPRSEATADNEFDAPPIPIRPSTALDDESYNSGSRTWSTHPKPIRPVLNPAVTPLPTFPTLPPLLFTLPAIPTLPAFTQQKQNNIHRYNFNKGSGNSNRNNNNNVNNSKNNNNNSNNNGINGDRNNYPHRSSFMDTSSTTNKNQLFSIPHSDGDILQTAFAAPLDIISSLRKRFQRSAFAVDSKLSGPVDDESLDFLDEFDSGGREKRSEYYDQVENESKSDRAAAGYNGHRQRTVIVNEDGVGKPKHGFRALINHKLNYGKLSGYEECFRYLDRPELRLF